MNDNEQDDHTSTSAIVHRVKATGDGFDGLYARLAPAIHGWARLRLPHRMQHVINAEDLVQEIWYEALRSFESYDTERATFRRWIFGIANNVLLRHRRRFVLHGEAAVASRPRRERLADELQDECTALSQRACRSEEAQAILNIAHELAEDERLLFVHCAIEGYPAAQAAELLGIEAPSATKRWQRLKRRLRGQLGELLVDPDGDLNS